MAKGSSVLAALMHGEEAAGRIPVLRGPARLRPSPEYSPCRRSCTNGRRPIPAVVSDGMSTGRAGCGESRTSGSEGGPEKPIVRKTTGRSGPTLHLRPDRGGVRVSRRGARCVQPPRGGLGDGQPPAHRAGARSAGHGTRTTTPSLGHSSFQGCRYTSLAFSERCRQAGVVPSTGSVGDCYDCEDSFAREMRCSSTEFASTTIATHSERSSPTSRGGITHTGVTKAWVTGHPSTSRGPTGTLDETQAVNRPLKRISSRNMAARHLRHFPKPLLDDLCQRRSKSTPLAGVKMHHLMRFSPALAVVPESIGGTRAASCSACVTRSEAAWEVPVGPPGQPWAGLSGFWGFPPVLGLVETVAVAVHLQDMNVVCEPVQQRPSQALGTEHLGPLIER